MMKLLEVNKLTKTFRKNKRVITAVDDVSFYIEPGKCMGLVGESGCGKSTTANIVARLLKEDSGDIIFDGKRISGKRLKPVRKDLQMVFQNPQDSFDPRDTLLSGVMQGAASLNLYDHNTLKKKSLENIELVGLKPALANTLISEFSGGECQRAAIARAILCEPKFVICDEATSALDVLVQAQIVSLLKTIQAEKHLALLFITHDLPLASVLCDSIAVMSFGRVVEIGAPQQVLHDPKHKQTKRLLSSLLPVKTRDAFDLTEPN